MSRTATKGKPIKKAAAPIKPYKPDPWDRTRIDNMHFKWDKVLAYDKLWNFGIGERESGKTVDSWILLYNALYFLNRPSIVLRRRQADITNAYLSDIAATINKFLKPENRIQLLYLKGDIGSGIADVRVAPESDGVIYWNSYSKYPIFFRTIALGVPMNRIKSMMLPHVKYMFYDECLANTVGGEKYLNDEYTRVMEIRTTYNREAETPIRILAAGNPYSVWCPIFAELGVDTRALKPGAFVVGDLFVIDCFVCPPQLKAAILAQHPEYQFDDAYTRYAFNGESLNDQNIRLHKQEPKGFKLRYVFKIGHNYLSVHHGQYKNKEGKATYWVCTHRENWLRKLGKHRRIVVFDFADLIAGAVKMNGNIELSKSFISLKQAMNNREIMYNNVDGSYILQDLSIYF